MQSKWCLTAVFVLAALIGSQDAAGQGRGVPGGVAFNSARDGNNDIYVMNWDGSGVDRITDHPLSDTEPAVSPNGRDVVFTSNRDGNNDIFIVDSTGRNPVNLTKHAANDGWPRWSPDGRQIVFHTNRDGNFEIYVMNIDGSSPTRITNYPGIDQFPDWSPDGREIVFRRDVDIYVIDLATGQTRRLTETAPLLNQMATWSPNGKQLVFMSARDGYPSVFVMNADGSGQINLTPKDPGDLDSQWISRAPSWSTTGRQIYFMSSRPSTGLDTEIFIMASDGTGLAQITDVIGVDGNPRAR